MSEAFAPGLQVIVRWPGHPTNGAKVEVVGKVEIEGLDRLGLMWACRGPKWPDPIVFRQEQLQGVT